MSRIGKLPVVLPEKVQCQIEGTAVKVKGPKGELNFCFAQGVSIQQEENKIVVKPTDTSLKSRALWGMTRTLIANMVQGVTEGFTRQLQYNGVGYKAAVKGSVLNLNLGYSHPIDYQLPEGITAQVKDNLITLSGIDKELLGRVAAKIRSFRPPEPYKGKGVKYLEEVIIRKAGKTAGKK